jgi:hypothetical protein
MAMDLQVAGVNVKKQSAWAVLGLGFITLGIYIFFWVYRVNREMRDIGRVYNDAELANVTPGLSVVAAVIPIANLVGLHRIGTRIQRVQALTGRGADYSLGLHWLLAIFTGLWFCYSQHALSTTYDWFARGTTPTTPLMPTGQLPVPAAATPSGPQVPGGPFVG